MSHHTTYTISQDGARLEQAFSALYRQAQIETRGARRVDATRVDFMLAACNLGTWMYTLTSLLHHL